MRVLFVSSEVDPLVKTGGLGDVSAALPGALRELGIDVRILVPGYPGVLTAIRSRCVAQDVELLPGVPAMRLLHGRLPHNDTPLYILDCPALYDREGGPYRDPEGAEWSDNALRFAALARGAALLGRRASPLRWRADIVHCNDWQTALTPAYLRFDPQRCARSLLTVHNLAFHGSFPASLAPALCLPAEGYSMDGYEFYGRISFLKAGLYYADQLATVSPRYAREIQSEAYGCGMHGLLAARAAQLNGILNGIDTTSWDPRTDHYLRRRYSDRSLHGKSLNKTALQARFGLAQNSEIPVLGMVTRLTHQKGVDLVPEALALIGERPWQLVVLGSGDPVIERRLLDFTAEWPDRVGFVSDFDEGLAHRIEGGADLFLMPSRFEPCGLNQMYSMRYATPPVVRRTGGLADTVIDAQAKTLDAGTATGFVFDTPEAEGLAEALSRALDCYADPKAWRGVQRAGMRRDFSWRPSALRYREIYATLLER